MKRRNILSTLRNVVSTLGVSINYFSIKRKFKGRYKKRKYNQHQEGEWQEALENMGACRGRSTVVGVSNPTSNASTL